MNGDSPSPRRFDLGPVDLHNQGPSALQWATFALVLLLVLATNGVAETAPAAEAPTVEQPPA